MKTEAIFVGSDGQILRGERAEERLKDRSDVSFFEPGRGVLQVPRSRWEEAQEYERSAWLERGSRLMDDRNALHAQRFAGYSMLSGRKFERAIELGCGPFTNMRYILETTEVDEVHLLDPLLNQYLLHAHCRYRGSRLGGVLRRRPPSALASLRHPVLAGQQEVNRFRVGGLFGRDIISHSISIEDFTSPLKFDLVVMINVLEHCRDATAIFEKIKEILAPGGIFVFQDKVYSATDVSARLATEFDMGHPLRVDQSVISSFLAEEFHPLMDATYLLDRPTAESPKRVSYYVGQRI